MYPSWYRYFFAPQSLRKGRSSRLRFRPEVLLLEERVVPSTYTEVEPNGAVSNANLSVVPTGDILTTRANDWLSISGSISTPTDQDIFRFTLSDVSSRYGVFFDVDSRETGLSTTLNSFLTVFNSTGTVVLGSNDNGYDFLTGWPAPTQSANSSSADASLYLELTPGTYLVRVTSVSSTTGSYTLRILADPNFTSTVPVFASNPGATDTLFLDFDGHSGAPNNDAWAFQAGQSYTIQPYDFNGNGSEWSPAERLAIRNAWRIVAEDYSPFNLNVTTSYSGSFANGVGYRTVIGNSNGSELNNPGITSSTIGISFLNSYTSGGSSQITDNVGFVFVNNYGSASGGISGTIMGTPVRIGGTASHEFGHAVRLRHYQAPNAQPQAILNNIQSGISRLIWASGTNELGQFQDDVATIASSINTIGFRADDHGNSTATATTLTATGNRYTASGIISQLTDVDYFRFTATGTTNIVVSVDRYINDLNPRLRLFNASGVLLNTVDPGDLSNPTLNVNLAAGTYFVEVSSHGDTGELGQYGLQITTGFATQILDDSANGFNTTFNAATGAVWTPLTGQGSQGTVHQAAPGTGTTAARWTFSGLTAGVYRVSATWTAAPDRATNAPYTVFNGGTALGTVAVNQENTPNDFTEAGVGWRVLGYFTITGSTLVVQLSDNADEFVIADAIRIERVAPLVFQTIDNGDPGFSVTPGWVLLDDTTFGVFQGLQGDVHYTAAGSGSEVATWTFANLAPGAYRVSTTWFPHANRATNAPYTVFDGTTSGTSLGTVLVNQELTPNDFRDAGIGWKDLGTFTITGTTLTVRLTDLANEYVIADAVRIERVGFTGRILDNGETGFSVTSGWALLDDTTFGVFQGLQGDVHFAAAGSGAELATWTFSGLEAGNYRVSATWFADPNRATNAPYTILDGGTTLTTVQVNQELTPNDFTDAGIGWRDLGVVTIIGNTLVVRLSDNANEYVIADAIRIERLS